MKTNGNGLLYGLIAVGVVMVLGGLALELMPELTGELFAERSAAVEPDVRTVPPPPPLQPSPPASPVPQAPMVPGLPPPAAAIVDAEAERTILWHVEAPGEPPVACVLHLQASLREQTWHADGVVRIVCADGRNLTGRVPQQRLEGTRLADGVSFGVDLRTFAASDEDGNRVSVRVNSSQRSIVIDGSSTFPRELFVEQLSVPYADTEGFAASEVQRRSVRLAVPTMVSGRIPVAIAMVRGTGRAPRASDPACELTASPALGNGYNCRLLLRCHGETIYGLGTSGYNACSVRDGSVTDANDTGSSAEDTDPRLEVHFGEGTLTVSDQNLNADWSATFDLITDPRLSVDQQFTGSYAAVGGSGRWSVSPFTVPPTMSFDDETQTLSATAGRFANGEYSILVEQGNVMLAFGRGARSIAGVIDGRTVWGFAPLSAP